MKSCNKCFNFSSNIIIVLSTKDLHCLLLYLCSFYRLQVLYMELLKWMGKLLMVRTVLLAKKPRTLQEIMAWLVARPEMVGGQLQALETMVLLKGDLVHILDTGIHCVYFITLYCSLFDDSLYLDFYIRSSFSDSEVC